MRPYRNKVISCSFEVLRRGAEVIQGARTRAGPSRYSATTARNRQCPRLSHGRHHNNRDEHPPNSSVERIKLEPGAVPQKVMSGVRLRSSGAVSIRRSARVRIGQALQQISVVVLRRVHARRNGPYRHRLGGEGL